jgi:hypothetical protein
MTRVQRPAQRVSRAGLQHLWRSLSERDLAILASVGACRLLTAQQIQRWHFPADARHHTRAGAERVARRVLARLVQYRLLARLQRRIGGVRAGSAGYVYALGPVGHRLMDDGGPRQRTREPSPQFVDHTLAVAEVVVSLAEADRAAAMELLEWQPEPQCWRRFQTTAGVETLKPDLRLTLADDEQEYHWFVEVDRGTAHLPTLLGKCARYAAYYQTGQEQAAEGVFPRVAWLTTAERAEQLPAAIANDTRLPQAVFVVAAEDNWRELLLEPGGRP